MGNKGVFVKGDPRAGRPKGCKNKRTRAFEDFLRQAGENPELHASLLRRLIAGRAAHVESLMARDALGDPAQKHQVQGEIVIRWQQS